MGITFGTANGSSLGDAIDLADGATLGTADGVVLGLTLGALDGNAQGITLGTPDGMALGVKMSLPVKYYSHVQATAISTQFMTIISCILSGYEPKSFVKEQSITYIREILISLIETTELDRQVKDLLV